MTEQVLYLPTVVLKNIGGDTRTLSFQDNDPIFRWCSLMQKYNKINPFFEKNNSLTEVNQSGKQNIQ